MPGPSRLAWDIASCLACRLYEHGSIVWDPPFRGQAKHEARAAAFTLATLRRHKQEKTPCGVPPERLAQELEAHIESLRDPNGLWETASASVFVLAFTLEAHRRGDEPPAWAREALEEATRRPHLPNQEAFSIYALTLYSKLTGQERPLRRARRRLRLLELLARDGPLWEPWGDTPVYTATAAWILGLAHEAGLAGAGRLARQLSGWTAPLVESLPIPALSGRSSWFSFNIPTLLAATRPGGGTRHTLLRAVEAYHYMEECPYLAKNPARATVITSYGVEEVYASWASRALLDATNTLGVESRPGRAPETSILAWTNGIIVASARGYQGFGNYQPPCTPATILDGGRLLVLSTLSSQENASLLAPVWLDGTPLTKASRVDCRAENGSIVCRCILEGGPRARVRRTLTLSPAGVVVEDKARGGRARLESRVPLASGAPGPGGTPVYSGVPSQAGPLTVYSWSGRGATRARIPMSGGQATVLLPAVVTASWVRYRLYLALGGRLAV